MYVYVSETLFYNLEMLSRSSICNTLCLFTFFSEISQVKASKAISVTRFHFFQTWLVCKYSDGLQPLIIADRCGLFVCVKYF